MNAVLMNARQEMGLRFVGVAPMLMRAGRLADPLDPHTVALQRVTGKRAKTQADHQQISRLEFRGSLWLADGRPCVPAEAIEAALVAAGRMRRNGRMVRAAVVVQKSPLLAFDGPGNLDERFDAGFFHRCAVRVANRTTMRTRPQFDDWSIDVKISFLPSMIDAAALRDLATMAGDLIGIGDFRPRFGRFQVEPVG